MFSSKMTSLLWGIIFLIIGLIGIDMYSSRHKDLSIPVKDCVPTFADGDGPYYKPNVPYRSKLSPQNHQGEKLVVYGRVLRKDCTTPVKNVTLDIWQADEKGTYQNETYRGKVKTDNRGFYIFETVKPKGYGEGTGYRPAHIHFKVWDGTRLIITSEMFFPEVKGTPGFDDAFIMHIESEGQGKERHLKGNHDIILPE